MSVTDERVEVIYADPEAEAPRVAQLTEIPRRDWVMWGGALSPVPGEHLELGIYEGEVRVVRVDAAVELGPPALTDDELDATLGYIRRWERQAPTT